MPGKHTRERSKADRVAVYLPWGAHVPVKDGEMHPRISPCLASLPKLSRRAALLLVAAGVFFFLLVGGLGRSRYAEQVARWGPSFLASSLVKQHKHPIDDLVVDADHAYESLVEKRTSGVSAAASAYRARRGRHPPPEFDKWVEYAEQKGALVVEDFFDAIYDNLEPFWSMRAKNIRKSAASWPTIISVRKHTATIGRSPNGQKKKLKWRVDMLKQIQSRLPDVDLAIGLDYQQPVAVPWEDLTDALAKANESRAYPLLPPESVPFNKFVKLKDLPRPDNKGSGKDASSYWDTARNACPEGSSAHSTPQDQDFSTAPSFPKVLSNSSYKGYAGNWTAAKSPCAHPELRNLHGAFIAPDAKITHTDLFPLFADSKIQDMNNVILFPGRYSWDEPDAASFLHVPAGGDVPWRRRKTALVWRGLPSGGSKLNKNNWTRFQRHRFVAMTNSSWVEKVAATVAAGHTVYDPPLIFPPPLNSTWALTAWKTRASDLGQWIAKFFDIGFVGSVCDSSGKKKGKGKGKTGCDYVDPYYEVRKEVETKSLLADWKYHADIDADGPSVKFLKFLASGSVPLKATVFSEWHDSRLVPWKHFVPLDNTFADLWGVMEYFVGAGGDAAGSDAQSSKWKKREADGVGHDEVAQAIAEHGQDWARRVLRREDVLLYVYRLVLEYARLCDDRRDNMGYVKDLIH